MFRNTNQFHINKSNFARTPLGGLFSILLLGIFIFLFFYLGKEFLKGIESEAKTSTYKETMKDLNITISNYLRTPKSQLNSFSIVRLSPQIPMESVELKKCTSEQLISFFYNISEIANEMINIEELHNKTDYYNTLKYDTESYDHFCFEAPLNSRYKYYYRNCRTLFDSDIFKTYFTDKNCIKNITNPQFTWRIKFDQLTETLKTNKTILEMTEKTGRKVYLYEFIVQSYKSIVDNGLFFKNKEVSISYSMRKAGAWNPDPNFPMETGIAIYPEKNIIVTEKSKTYYRTY
jgi:hypothetical protein